eukprot:369411_1
MNHHASPPPIPLITIRPRVGQRTVKKIDTPTIKISESDDQKEVKRHTVCLVCTSAVASYTCPRCLVPYCGSSCYKAHGHNCTESFFRDRVERVLDLEKEEKQVNEGDVREKRSSQKIKMEEMLRRVLLDDSGGFDEKQQREEDDDNDAKGSISEERLEELLSLMEKWEGRMDEGMVSSLLDEEELQRFHRAIAGGSLSRLVSSESRAPPWWLTCGLPKRCTELVEEDVEPEEQAVGRTGSNRQLDENDGICYRHQGSRLLSEYQSLPPLSTIYDGTVSPSMFFLALDIVLSYGASASQYPGGCWCGDAWSAARDMVAVSPSLSAAATPNLAGGDKIIYSGEEEVLIAVLERCQRELQFDAELVLTHALELLKPTSSDGDVKELPVTAMGKSSGTTHLIAVSALLDAKKMLEAAIDDTVHKKERRRLKPLARKLWFVALWSASDGGRKLGLLREALEQAKKLGIWKGPSQGSETFSFKLQSSS